jgi:hypothetical protein
MSPGWICDSLTLVPSVFHIPDVVPRPEKSAWRHMIQSTSPEQSNVCGLYRLASLTHDDYCSVSASSLETGAAVGCTNSSLRIVT